MLDGQVKPLSQLAIIFGSVWCIPSCYGKLPQQAPYLFFGVLSEPLALALTVPYIKTPSTIRCFDIARPQVLLGVLLASFGVTSDTHKRRTAVNAGGPPAGDPTPSSYPVPISTNNQQTTKCNTTRATGERRVNGSVLSGLTSFVIGAVKPAVFTSTVTTQLVGLWIL